MTDHQLPDHQPLVLLVGHCGPDSFMLKNVVHRALPGARIEMADDRQALEAHLSAADVLLINRVLEADIGVTSGVELIRRLAAREGGSAPAMMLVSNFPDAQAEAEAAGAMPGFGKRDAYADLAAQRLRDAAARARSAAP